eukprot:7993587-Lingulodinium_polyedra.AAC.1
MVVGPGGIPSQSSSSMAMRAAQDSAMTELAPSGMTQTRSCTLCQRSPRRAQAMAAPAATLWPRMVRDPPSK